MNIVLVANDDELGLAPGQNTFIVFALQVGCQQDQQRDLKSLNETISETEFGALLSQPIIIMEEGKRPRFEGL